MSEIQYITDLYLQEDEVLLKTRESMAQHGMPDITIPPQTAKILYLLVKMSGAQKILEVGTLAGYSGIWLARALPETGTLLTLEIKPQFAQVAAENFRLAGLQNKVQVQSGNALAVMEDLLQDNAKFDFFFFDADKLNLPKYLQLALKLAAPGAIITADNTLWKGRVYDPTSSRPTTKAVRLFNKMLAEDRRLESIIIPSGDGLSVARVKDNV
ncbi:MAG: O-methyltransferase [Dethiobacteraceae bacterium]|jgi:caffeoyl-CoA O-methyltransferase|nr:O-methyltransferase [Bacillota bacterium]